MTPEPLLLATDLDRTLVPNGPQPESPGARRILGRLLESAPITLAYVSGRHLELVQSAIAEYDLPTPDFVVGDVGTTVYRRDREGWTPLADWDARLDREWGDADRGELLAELGELPGMTVQEPGRQNRHKLSFLFETALDEVRLVDAIRERMAARGLDCRVVCSLDDIAGTGLIDVLPATASKLHALEALMAARRVAAERTVFCGDSGNDLDVLASAIPAVLVANASGIVREAAVAAARRAGHADRLYLARGGFRGLNGNYAAGILEGLVHFHPRFLDLMDAEAGP